MANVVTFEVEGVGEVLSGIDAYARRIEEGVEALVRKYTRQVMRGAQSRLSADLSELEASIRSDLQKTATEIIGEVNAGGGLETPEFAAYWNWGTGSEVVIKDESLRDYAWTFFVNGLGRLPPTHYMSIPYIEAKKDFIRSLRRLLND